MRGAKREKAGSYIFEKRPGLNAKGIGDVYLQT